MADNENSLDIKLKILMAGPLQCGKSSMMRKFVERHFATDFKSMMGVDILAKSIKLSNGEKIGVFIWDINEEDKFELIRDRFYRGGSGAILVFDVNRPETCEQVKEIHTKMEDASGSIPFMLLGNKLEYLKADGDDSDSLTDERVRTCKKWAEENGGFYLESRSDDVEKIDKGLIQLTKMIYSKISESDGR